MICSFFFCGMVLLGGEEWAFSSDHQKTRPIISQVFSIDMLDVVAIPETTQVFGVGKQGKAAWLQLNDDHVVMSPISGPFDEDFTAVTFSPDNQILAATATGRMYRFQEHMFQEIAQISEFQEPILDLLTYQNTIWVCGARGLLAHSFAGDQWEILEVQEVVQPALPLPHVNPAIWQLGVGNINPESFQLRATIQGRSPIEGQDFVFETVSGELDILTPLDSSPPPTVTFTFQPGPPFMAGDVTWNVMMISPQHLTLAGEFGLILQSPDRGKTWVRRNGSMSEREGNFGYWLSGAKVDNRLLLVGTAGTVLESRNDGIHWKPLSAPSEDALFGAHYVPNSSGDLYPLVVGAVGFVGQYQQNQWTMIDRTQLNVSTWLHRVVPIGADQWLIVGGRGTMIGYRHSQWHRLPVQLGRLQ